VKLQHCAHGWERINAAAELSPQCTLKKELWLCSALNYQGSVQASAGILQPLCCSLSIQVPGALADMVCMSITQLQPLDTLVSPGLQIGFFVPLAAES